MVAFNIFYYKNMRTVKGGHTPTSILLQQNSTRMFLDNEINCCCSVALSCPALCDSMDCSTSGFPVFHYLPEFAQTHVHWVSDVIQPSHPLPPPSPLALNLSQYQGLFQWVDSASGGQSIGASALVLPKNIQGWFPLGLTGLMSWEAIVYCS